MSKFVVRHSNNDLVIETPDGRPVALVYKDQDMHETAEEIVGLLDELGTGDRKSKRAFVNEVKGKIQEKLEWYKYLREIKEHGDKNGIDIKIPDALYGAMELLDLLEKTDGWPDDGIRKTFNHTIPDVSRETL